MTMSYSVSRAAGLPSRRDRYHGKVKMKKYIAAATALLLVTGFAYEAFACAQWQSWVCTTFGNQTSCRCQ
jgi:hypothetical protein